MVVGGRPGRPDRRAAAGTAKTRANPGLSRSGGPGVKVTGSRHPVGEPRGNEGRWRQVRQGARVSPSLGAGEAVGRSTMIARPGTVAGSPALMKARSMTDLILVAITIGAAWVMSAPAAADPPPSANLVPLDLAASTERASPPAGLLLTGDATYGPLGDAGREVAGRGIRLVAGDDVDGNGRREGAAATTVANLGPAHGRWFRFRIRGLAQDDFAVGSDDLFLEAEFFRGGGRDPLDSIKQEIYPLVERDRLALRDGGTNERLGRGTWRSYDMVFRTPFPDVDTITLRVGFGHGEAAGPRADFHVSELDLRAIPVPPGYVAPHAPAAGRPKADAATMVPLGGRWYYDPRGGDRTPPAEFGHATADRLFYLSDRLECPFADNMTAWLRTGWLDAEGKLVERDRPVPDNVVVSFTDTHLVVRSHNLPNHPTAVFPDVNRSLDGNPNYVRERVTTMQFPLEPRVNPRHVAMQDTNNNDHALPMGPIGVAVNGVVFFNPFDHLLDEDAIWRLDRCCGHPSPRAQYHYHKYPVCVKSPWADDGAGHSPLIGFANDGFPVYGPYESAGVLARNDASRPLNEFNLHEDPERGPHYHVTPGRFPHIIGGFWGVAEPRRPGPPGGGPPRRPLIPPR